MRGRRTIRRWFVRAVVFLVLGAVVNVAVAWGVSQNWVDGGAYGKLTARESRIIFERFDAPYLDNPSASTIENCTKGIGWTRGNAKHYADGGGIFEIVELRIGWPCRSLVGQAWEDDESFHAILYLPRMRPLRIEDLNPQFLERWVLVTHPLWPGFAVNTAFYAAIVWILFAIPVALRRRRRIRKGRCPQCAYPVGESDVCTECGHAVR